MGDEKSKVTDKAGEIAKNIWLAGVGAYGKAVEDAQGRLEKAGMEPPKLFKELVKAGTALEDDAREALESTLKLLAPFTPHVVEELWERIGGEHSVFSQDWPVCDQSLLVEDEWQIVVQVNGKVRGKITVAADSPEEEIRNMAMDNPRIGEWTEKGTVRKVIYVPGKLLNIVVQ